MGWQRLPRAAHGHSGHRRYTLAETNIGLPQDRADSPPRPWRGNDAVEIANEETLTSTMNLALLGVSETSRSRVHRLGSWRLVEAVVEHSGTHHSPGQDRTAYASKP
jgi:hypothetical protein